MSLAELSARLGSPGAEKLYIAARRRGLQVTRADVHALVRKQGERQIFGPARPSEGKSASEGPDVASRRTSSTSRPRPTAGTRTS